MASVASVGTSPLSGCEYTQGSESIGDEEDAVYAAYAYSVSMSATSDPIGFMPSPTNNSLSSWAMIGPGGNIQPSPPALSPLNADFGASSPFSAGSYPDQTGSAAFNAASASADGQYLGQQTLSQDGQQQSFNMLPGEFVFDSNMNLNVDGKDYRCSFPHRDALTAFNRLHRSLQQQPLTFRS